MASPDKVAAVEKLTDRFRESSAVVFTEYRGLTVRQIGDLRTVLDGHATFSVVKNTLTRRAAGGAGLTVDDALLTGPSAVAFVTGDVVVVAKGLRDFARANPALVVKAGVLDGRSLDAGEVARLADLESREVLLAKLAGAFNALPQRAVSLLAAPLSQAVRLVDALRTQVAANAPADAAPDATPDSATAAVEAVLAEPGPVESAPAVEPGPAQSASEPGSAESASEPGPAESASEPGPAESASEPGPAESAPAGE